MAAPEAPEKKQFRASSAVALKTLSAWEQANLSPWYHPQFWLDLLIHPSKEFTMNHQRRRARLYALVSFIFLVVSVIGNIIFAEDGRPSNFLATHAVVNILLGLSYIISRTRYAQVGKTLGVFAVWLLPYVSFILNLRDEAITDVTVTDSVSWLFTPSWMLMAAIFLSRSATVGVVMLDAFSLLLLPSFAGCSFFAIRKLLLFHIVCNSLLMMASIIAFRDKLQLYSQHDGQSHEDQHQAGSFARFLLQPHNDITDRIFRRRSRILSAFLLLLIPSMLAWMIVEASRYSSDQSDGVVLGLTVVLLVSSVVLYIVSRTQYTRWASRLTLFMLLVAPYVYYQAPTTTMEGQLFANLITMTSAAILGITLFSGAELVALAAIIFFPTVYSPLFPPHVIMSLILLVSSFIYRRDIKEIHDTAFHRDDLYEDDTSDLLIPWEKKYFFGKLSYIQMVQAHYGLGFFLICTLGLAALVGVATSDVKVLDMVSATQVPEDDATYVLYITTNACPSPIPQIYTITGANAYFEVKNTDPLGENTINALYVKTSSEVGPIVTISVKLGDGRYSLTQYDTCSIDQVELWDPVEQRAYSTSVNQLAPGASPSPAGRRLLGGNDRDDGRPFSQDDDCDDLATVQIGGLVGQFVASFDEVSRCRFRIPGGNIQKCVKFLQSVGVSPLSWATNACQIKNVAINPDRLMPCYELGCQANTPTCNGHGSCVVLRQLSVDRFGRSRYRLRGGWHRQNLAAVCNCSVGYFGDRCQYTFSSYCSTEATDHYEYDGTCTVPSSPTAGAVGQNTPRLGQDSYVGRNFQPATSAAVVPTVSRALLSDITKQNRLAVAFTDFILEDIIVPSRLASTGASSPLGNPFAAWCSVAPEYSNIVTSWIDASPIYGVDEDDKPIIPTDDIGRIDRASVQSRFANRDPGFRLVVNLTLEFHDEAVARIAAYNSPTGPNPISLDTRFEIARYFSGLWLQNIARFHVLPSFFDANIQIPDYNAFITNTAFTSTHWLSQAKLGEIPLAAATDLLVTLREGTFFASDPMCNNSANPSTDFPLMPFAESIADFIFTKAPPFGSGATGVPGSTIASDFPAARRDALQYGLPSYQELYCNLNPPCATPPPCAGARNAQEFFNQVHQTARQAPWTPAELALANAPANYVSSYPPVAFWLTFGVIRKAYTTDPHRWDVANNNGAFDVWDRSSSNVVRNNIFSTIFNSCNTDPNRCADRLNLIRRLINSKDSLQDFLDSRTDGLLVGLCDSIREPLVATQLPGINVPGPCCALDVHCNFCFS